MGNNKERDGKNEREADEKSIKCSKNTIVTLSSSFLPSKLHAISLDTIMVKSLSLENNDLLHLLL